MEYLNVPRASDRSPTTIENERRFQATLSNMGTWNARNLVQDLLFGSPLSLLKFEAIFDLFVHSADYHETNRFSIQASESYAWDVDSDALPHQGRLSQRAATRENFIQVLRKAIGDLPVLNVIGEIEGLDDVNNPSREAWVPLVLFSPVKIRSRQKPPVYFFDPGQAKEALQQARENQDASRLSEMRAMGAYRELRIYGEHQSEKRILEFWKAFHCRINIGDSIPHAIQAARLHLNHFGVLSRPEMQYGFKFFYPNELTGYLYSPGEMIAQYPELKALSALIQRELLKQLLALYGKLLPEDADADAERGLLTQLEKKSQEAYLAAQAAGGQKKASLLVPTLAAGTVLFLLSRK